MSENLREHVPIPLPWRLKRELHLPRAPWWMVAMLVAFIFVALLPLIWLLTTRGRPFSSPRVDWIQDMGVQPRMGPQAVSALYADGRAMRPPVSGTIAQGSLQHDAHFFAGYATQINPETQQSEITFFEDLPPSIGALDLAALQARGEQRFEIYCTPCHGATGAGDGLVSLRAKELLEPKWVVPTHLMTQAIRDKPDGYLFSVISRGVRNMPSYSIQIAPADRWAIVAYLRKLQSTQPVAPEPANPAAASVAPTTTTEKPQ